MTTERICLVGFDQAESDELARLLPTECVAYEMLPRILLQGGRLSVLSPNATRMLPVSRVVFHGIFEHDSPFLSALALWGGPCFPSPLPMVDCRPRLSCLARAVRLSRFAAPARGFVSAHIDYRTEGDAVAKWGDWHCGENKERFRGVWNSGEPCLVEPFFAGEAIRVMIVGRHTWQIRMTGSDWKKSVHGPGAEIMDQDADLVADTRAIKDGLGLDLIANDYMVSETSKHLLEVNHIPSLTCCLGLWEGYLETVVPWCKGE